MGLVRKSSKSPLRVALALTTACTCSKYLTSLAVPEHAFVSIFITTLEVVGISLKIYFYNYLSKVTLSYMYM